MATLGYVPAPVPVGESPQHNLFRKRKKKTAIGGVPLGNSDHLHGPFSFDVSAWKAYYCNSIYSFTGSFLLWSIRYITM